MSTAEFSVNKIESGNRDSAAIKAVIFDIDKTLIYPKNNCFYENHSRAVEVAISKHRDINLDEAKKVANSFRKTHGGGEYALFYPEPPYNPNYSLLYHELCKINPKDEFIPNERIINLLDSIRKNGVLVIGLTNSVDHLIKKCLLLSGLDPNKIFDVFISYEESSGPPKTILKERIFSSIVNELSLMPKEVISVGDSYKSDILTARNAGLRTCFIANNPLEQNDDYCIDHIEKLSEILKLK